jgi:hypothetical protein
MKKQMSTAKVKGVGEIETPETNPLLIHFLSPLERAAYRHQFKRFTYDLDGLPLEITPYLSKKLFYQSKKRINALRDLLQGARIKLLKQSDEKTRRFLLKPLKQQPLPTRVYHLLAGNYCRCMADVAEKGVHGLKRMSGMGPESVALVINLFAEHGCGALFE